MQYFYGLIYGVCLLLLCTNTTQAQTTISTTQDPKTGIRITSRSIPIQTKSLTEELVELEQKAAIARQDPQQVANGTVKKYEQVIELKKAQLAATPAPNKQKED